MTNKHKDIIIDFETLGYPPDGVVVNMAGIVFVEDIKNPPTFKELVDDSFLIKFDLYSQKGTRFFDNKVIEFWKNASDGMRKQLKVDGSEVDVNTGIDKFLTYCKQVDINPYKSLLWTRGNAFDIPLLIDLIRKRYNTRETCDLEPVKFWRTRDVRTAIERTLLVRDMTECPLPNGAMDGFISHNAIHDCARDILMLIYSQRYASGLEALPENPDPNSIEKKRT